MLIKIEKRTVELDVAEFIGELKRLADLYKANSCKAGFILKDINKEFKLKLTDGDFYQLMTDCNLNLSRGILWFKELDKIQNP